MAQRQGRSENRAAGRRVPCSSDQANAARKQTVDQRRLRRAVTEVVVAAECDLEELLVRRVGRRQVVRVAVDSDSGIDLDQIAELSRLIAARLDEIEATGVELVPGEYDLEVGSPGADRPLTLPRHWRRSRGRLVRVVVAGAGAVVGRVTVADDDGVLLDCEGTPRRFEYSQLGKGQVELEFNRPGEDLDDGGGDGE